MARISPDVARRVRARDGLCVAAKLGFAHWCKDWADQPLTVTQVDRMELDHIRDGPMMGKTAPSDPKHLVTLCHVAHQRGWATANRPLLRKYLQAVEG